MMVQDKLVSSIFITFSGNCKEALQFYQTCFGGLLQFVTFDTELAGFSMLPVVTGSLIADRIVIHGSDLVHNEGRKLGNYMAIFWQCKNINDRQELIKKLLSAKKSTFVRNDDNQELIEVTDAFDVRWVLGV
ncbi:MAG TPA: hypothetical protein VL088_00570 [Pedobacter sp.]|nr:hypothetical protein [Pedobacter sp.]